MTITNVKSALVSTVLMGLIAISGYFLQLQDVFKIDVHALINVGVMAFLTGLVSFLKSLLTTDAGNFVGVVKVVE